MPVERAIYYLLDCTYKIENPHLQVMTLSAIKDTRFQQGYGSATKHHAFVGGLPVHTAEVTAIALNMRKQFPDIPYDVMATAAILHDYMKIDEYEGKEDGTIEKLPYQKMVGHLVGSYAYVHHTLKRFNAGPDLDDFKMRIEHAILAHHGRLEWRTAQEPLTPEAHILHYADMMSSRFGATSPDQISNIIPPIL